MSLNFQVKKPRTHPFHPPKQGTMMVNPLNKAFFAGKGGSGGGGYPYIPLIISSAMFWVNHFELCNTCHSKIWANLPLRMELPLKNRVFLLKSVIISVYFIWVNTIWSTKNDTSSSKFFGWKTPFWATLLGRRPVTKSYNLPWIIMDYRSHASPNPTWKNFIPPILQSLSYHLPTGEFS